MKNQNKSFIWLIIFLVGFPQISETIYTPSLSFLASALAVSNNEIQKTLSIYFSGFAIGVFLWGILSDIIGRKSSMISGIILYIIGSILCYQSYSFDFLILARFIQALGASVGSCVNQTILRDVYTDKEQIGVFSTISAVLAFSPAIEPLLGSIVASIWDVYAVFIVLITMGFCAFFWSIFSLKETLILHEKPKYNYKQIVKNIGLDKSFWIYGGLIGVVNGVIFSYYGEAPFIFIDYFKFTIVEYGCIGFAIAIANFLGARYCKKLNGKKSHQRILFTGNCIFFFGTIVLLLAAIFLKPHSVILISTFLAAIFIIFFGLACMLPICLSNALINHKANLGISGAFLGLYYYAIVGGVTFLMSFFHTLSLFVLPLFLLFWFTINSVLILMNRK
ncbi:multidrug effflux MFS transporter [Elizabethkingia sp. JS20170427COW]|uniref:multidrug effflux MFS transporter n=1 Tax=Elizabethkingia sp. JS20170427COW TaxID=2583851 RepID=UPI001110F6BE|nr:multidrug effflux MFS transporter [Elizabethkingia sp. JS20170427COW]QCX52684.1 multidrug effflux MFS transporter [Elizabethkingia sp. JS20170427COW]